MSEQKKDRSRPRAFTTDERGATHRLTIEKEDDGYCVSVHSGDEEPDGVLVETTDSGMTEIRHVRSMANAHEDDRVVIVPKGRGVFEVFAVHDDETARTPVVVEFSSSASPDETAQIGRLYRVLGEEELIEDTAERPIDADQRDRALVFPDGRRSDDIYPSDLLHALHEVADLIDDRPGDPGRGVHLARRVESVLEEFERKARGGR